MLAACRLDSLTFDIAASAGWYSAIAGLLAGFALLSILLPLDHEARGNDESNLGHAVVLFACAFLSLLILGFLFAVLAGRTGDDRVDGVAANEQLLYGSAFGLSSILLLFGLSAVLRTYGANRNALEPAQRVMVFATGLLGPMVLLALQFGSALDIARFRTAAGDLECDLAGLPNSVWIDLAIVLTAATVLLVLWVLRDRLPNRSGAPASAAKAVLVYTTVIAIWGSMVVPLLSSGTVTETWFEHLTLTATALATVGVAASTWMGRTRDGDSTRAG